ncbi:MAG: hypothetical protein A2W91_06595 [Bacteroidetes bacterium GWF2_38_335]|nr:MAG: hypothetical protein A2W91_06595 [Bacteroidetes bacterium GWF2_38_335]OFY77699.1 MAG: hypothetical protein A2281_18110 [Bacteroidetes bacterium RIFOXYA12_FULL_38_20]HBS89070.1 hypothetical protein [Bacteroidales bacterium]
MEEKVIKEAKAQYFKSATNMIEGFLVLTNKRILFSGTQARVKFNHGAVGNIIRDKMEKAMGYDKQEEENIFDIPLTDANHRFKRFGFSKRLVISDKQNNEYKLMLNVKKTDRDEWPIAIDEAKKGI